ncbi:hypothetical protein SAMN05444359_11633 [Neolewinella agarilytica]|uniref:Uncharacterized protein n=2 Tax=Neolewinella agarilytica TaxID=478744 RepID=A0A1H9IZL9_9BACT|nr:hypothetical protein SAMN05444359_11633 [Neolewinella agarilytica]
MKGSWKHLSDCPVFSKLAEHNSSRTILLYMQLHLRLFLAFSLSLIAFGALRAQGLEPIDLLAFNQVSLSHQQTAMLTLGGWAVANIAVGVSLQGGAEGSTKHFHRMNALWNTVNLGIAGLGYLTAIKSDPAGWDLASSLSKHQSFQKILLFNAGLDVGYIMGGLYLTERAKRPNVNADQLKGFGRSIMLQGAFLFAFDLVNVLIASGRDGDIPLLLGATRDGLGLTMIF